MVLCIVGVMENKSDVRRCCTTGGIVLICKHPVWWVGCVCQGKKWVVWAGRVRA